MSACRLSDLAKAIDAAIKEQVFDDDFFAVVGINVELAEDRFDSSWNMPEKFAQIWSYKYHEEIQPK
jgi:hypothetical protein